MKTNLEYVLEMESQLINLGWDEYLHLLGHALMARAECAQGMDAIEERNKWLNIANIVDDAKLREE